MLHGSQNGAWEIYEHVICGKRDRAQLQPYVTSLSFASFPTSYFTFAMFKGILPAKRISSSDFTMVTSLADVPANGKENQPGGQPQLATVTKIARPATATKGFQQPYEKKKKTESKGNVQPSGTVGPETNLAFDRLLVSILSSFLYYVSNFLPTRMTCKYLQLSAPNLLAWILRSRQPC